MKFKHALHVLAIILLFTALHTKMAQAQHPTDFLTHQHSITIYVDCMQEALSNIGRLPGFELSSQFTMLTGRGQSVRMVQNQDLDSALSLLNSFGSVSQSQSNATNLFSQWMRISAELNVRNTEYYSLMALLYSVTQLEDFRRIETRLQQVIGTTEQLRTQLNGLEFLMGSSEISINLRLSTPEEYADPEPEPELDDDEEPEEEPGTLRQIANAFIRSASYTLGASQAALIFIARISLPLVAIVVIGIFALRAYKRRKKQTVEEREDKNEEN